MHETLDEISGNTVPLDICSVMLGLSPIIWGGGLWLETRDPLNSLGPRENLLGNCLLPNTYYPMGLY